MNHVFRFFRMGTGIAIAEPLRRFMPLLLALAFLLTSACASDKAGLKSPELPARHWLDEAPGVPVGNKDKLENAISSLYEPDKEFSFEDCVFLSIQQSPLLVNSAVDLEINRVARTDAAWKYLPEPHLVLTVSNNLTRYNMDTRNTPGDYGRTKMRVDFYAPFPNPVATYFEHKVQQGLVNVAISMHRKAVGEVIYKIAESYLKLEAKRRIYEAERERLPLGASLMDYWKQVEKVEGRQGVSLNVASQEQRERELTAEKTRMEGVMERTNLKLIAGLDAQQRFNVDAESANSILEGFDGYALKWEDRWNCTEDDLLLRTQIKLGDYNIMLAWAQYVPNMSFNVNHSPPAGQYQPPNGQEDTFLHWNFDFPLLDWGRRYRGVQTARMKKAQAFHEMALKRTEYSNKWFQAEQQVALAETELKLQKTRLDTAEMRFREAQISFDEGTAELPHMLELQEAATKARVNYIKAELEYKLAQLKWMELASVLQERFLGPPAKEIL